MTRYRVTLEGARVHTQTWDHALNVDGWADEIYSVCSVKVVEQPGRVLREDTTRSKTMGDVNGFRDRIKAGSATRNGGIQRGDDIPYPDPWVRKSDISGDKFPMVVFEGDLTPERAVTLIPSIWEWDGGDDIFNSWGSVIAANSGAIVAATVNIISAIKGKPSKELGDFLKSNLDMGLQSLFLTLQTFTGQAKDRPIGMSKDGSKYAFSPPVLIVTSEVAEYVLNSSVGFGNGVLSLRYKDDSSIGGADYQLFVSIEKLDGGSTTPSIKLDLWLKALYEDLLGRAPDQGGLQYWLDLMKQGTTFDTVASGFLRSPEYCTQRVMEFYRRYLDREGEPEGVEYWKNILVSGVSFQQVIMGFCDSPEYKTKHPIPDAFVKSLYQKILDREGEPAGVAGWIEAVNTYGSAFAIGGFLRSLEFAIKRSQEYYRKFLRRESEGEPSGHADAITRGTPLQDIIRGFVTSEEYKQKSQSR